MDEHVCSDVWNGLSVLQVLWGHNSETSCQEEQKNRCYMHACSSTQIGNSVHASIRNTVIVYSARSNKHAFGHACTILLVTFISGFGLWNPQLHWIRRPKGSTRTEFPCLGHFSTLSNSFARSDPFHGRWSLPKSNFPWAKRCSLCLHWLTERPFFGIVLVYIIIVQVDTILAWL